MLIRVDLTGTRPLVMHNARLADPLDPVTQELAKLTSKRQKTPADHEMVADVEWRGSLYWDENGPFIPSEALLRSFRDAAGAWKLGPSVERALLATIDHLTVIHDGPKTIDALAKDKRYRLRKGVVVQRNRVVRTRPIFRSWALHAEFEWNESELSGANIERIAERAGIFFGIGTARRLGYGRFSAVVSAE